MSKINCPVDGFSEENGVEQFIVPFNSARLHDREGRPHTVLEIPSFVISAETADNLIAHMQGIFTDLTRADINEIVEDIIDRCRYRFVSQHMKRFKKADKEFSKE